MSTFGGKIDEIRNISVDRFDERNLDSKAYFLSHCHADHMVGLGSPGFEKRLLDSEGVYLHASAVSVTILKLLYPNLGPKLRALDLQGATLVEIGGGDFVAVTPIPAGHCPGSVMFFFEGDEGNVLYSGDYRLNPDDLPKFAIFRDALGERKRVDALYLDTTFFGKSFARLPGREESLGAIRRLIGEWLASGGDNVVELLVPARYGSEYLFMEMAKEFGMPVHVGGSAFDFYRCVPEMDDTVTADGETVTRLHSGCGCERLNSHPARVRRIKPSALIWKGRDLRKGIVNRRQNGVYSVCYSSHASYEEAVALIEFLQPKRVVPCVRPSDPAERCEMLELIAEVVESYSDDADEKRAIFFDVKDNTAPKKPETPERLSDCDENFILSSPPRPAKKPRF